MEMTAQQRLHPTAWQLVNEPAQRGAYIGMGIWIVILIIVVWKSRETR